MLTAESLLTLSQPPKNEQIIDKEKNNHWYFKVILVQTKMYNAATVKYCVCVIFHVILIEYLTAMTPYSTWKHEAQEP